LTPPSNVSFDLDYVKSYVLDNGGKFASSVTVNAAFTDSTLSAADFMKLVDGGVKFGNVYGTNTPVGKYLLSSSDSAFVSGNGAITNLLKLVNAGLQFANGSQEVSNASLSLSNASLLSNAGLHFASGPTSNNVLQLNAADLASTASLAKVNSLGISTIKLVSGAINLTQIDALANVPALSFAPGTALQLSDATSLTTAVTRALADHNYFTK
jgi:hypothetical protein